jgi:CBS domain-containing protein
MRVIETIRRSGIAVEPSRPIAETAALLEASGVGAVAVVDGEDLVGIVTDRDLAVRGLGRRLDPGARTDAVMTTPVVTIDAAADLHDAFALFRANPIRRLAVVRGNRFSGMVSIDDLLIDLAADLADLARPVTAEAIFGHRDAGLPATP